METTEQDLKPVGFSNSPYYLYQRKKDGLWISLNMGILYAILIAIGIWSQEYVLLGMTILIALGLVYDQLTNPQFLEITDAMIRYRLPRKSRGVIHMDKIQKVTLTPDQVKIDIGDKQPIDIEINALLSPKKRTELRSYLKANLRPIEELS